MSSPASNPDSSQIAPLSRDRAHLLTERIIDDSPLLGFSANAVLEAHPELRQFPSCVIDLAYEEFCRARESGNPIAASKFVEGFSTVQQSLYRVIEFDQVLHDHPSMVEEVPEDRWPRVGDRFLGFHLAEQLGRGALSRVFLARHIKLGQKPVVVKVCIRGEREADLLGKLEHPGIGEVHSIDIDDTTGLAAICMPFQTRFTMHHVAEWMMEPEGSKSVSRLQATEIAQHVRDVSQLTDEFDTSSPLVASPFYNEDCLEQVIVKWGVQLANAMSNAHAKGVLHCDVKPGNVLILPDLSARLLDFNLASSDADPGRLAGGTLPYMAPEQLNFIRISDAEPDQERQDDSADQLMDRRTDVFGLCATIWHMATGSPPFGTVVDSQTRRIGVEEMLRRISGGVEQAAIDRAELVLSAPTIQILLKGMSFRPDDRHSSMEELEAEFRSRVRARRRTRLVIAILAALALSIAAAALSSYIADPVPKAIAKARELLAARDPEGAQKVLDQVKFANDICRILELAARTSSLPSLNYWEERPGEPDEPALEWEKVLAEWEHLAKFTAYPDLCEFNTYLVKMEIVRDFELAFKVLAKVPGAKTDPKFEPRRMLLMKTFASQKNNEFQNTQAISQLVDSMHEGTRGEFIALFRMAFTEFRNDPSETASDSLDRLLLNLASDTRLAEPRVAGIWSFKRGKPDETTAKLQELLIRLRGEPNSRTYNNLQFHLKLPPKSN